MIADKKQMYSMLRAGLFGNSWWEWDVEDFVLYKDVGDLMRKQGHNLTTPMWAVRSGIPGGPFLQRLDFHDAYHEGERIRRKYGIARISPLDDFMGVQRVAQGYFQRDPFGGPGLYFNEFGTSGTMRDGEKERSVHHYATKASVILRHYLRDEYDDLVDLLDRFPDSVVEFTTYNKPVGLHSDLGKRTVIWEVRHY